MTHFLIHQVVLWHEIHKGVTRYVYAGFAMCRSCATMRNLPVDCGMHFIKTLRRKGTLKGLQKQTTYNCPKLAPRKNMQWFPSCFAVLSTWCQSWAICATEFTPCHPSGGKPRSTSFAVGSLGWPRRPAKRGRRNREMSGRAWGRVGRSHSVNFI